MSGRPLPNSVPDREGWITIRNIVSKIFKDNLDGLYET